MLELRDYQSECLTAVKARNHAEESCHWAAEQGDFGADTRGFHAAKSAFLAESWHTITHGMVGSVKPHEQKDSESELLFITAIMRRSLLQEVNKANSIIDKN